jgi:hypothetical protein
MAYVAAMRQTIPNIFLSIIQVLLHKTINKYRWIGGYYSNTLQGQMEVSSHCQVVLRPQPFWITD